MKHLLLLFVMLLASHSMLANSSLFQLDEDALQEEFAELSQLEQVVLNHSDMNLAMAQECNYLPDDFSSASADGFQSSQFAFQWEGFLWGFLCCPVGVFVVALNKNKSKDNKTSFWIGVAASTLLSALQTIAVGVSASTY